MSKLIATYGSLKRGFYNHGRCGEQHYVGDTSVRGNMTLVYNAYPQLVLDEGGPEHVVEVFLVDDLTYQQIHYMELGAGYTEINTLTPYGEAVMWVINDPSKQHGVPIDAYTEDLFELVHE